MFMWFRGGGVGHASTRDATIPLLSDRPYEELQKIDALKDIVEEELEDIAEEGLEMLTENELLMEGEPGPEELLDEDVEGEDEQDDESQHGSEDLEEEVMDYDDMWALIALHRGQHIAK